jgi:hypothetical protein
MTKTALAVQKSQEARVLRSSGRTHDHVFANGLDREVEALLKPVNDGVALGEALTPFDDDRPFIRDTLENPDGVAIDASGARMDLLADAGALELGLDTADAVNARNSAEKMLCHQIGATHAAAMKLFARANDDLPPVEQVRLTNGAARLLDSFQGCLLTLQKLRTGGRQRVLVQHQHIDNRGGQAVVAGRVEGGRPEK